jgi:hypothetical protein
MPPIQLHDIVIRCRDSCQDTECLMFYSQCLQSEFVKVSLLTYNEP